MNEAQQPRPLASPNRMTVGGLEPSWAAVAWKLKTGGLRSPAPCFPFMRTQAQDVGGRPVSREVWGALTAGLGTQPTKHLDDIHKKSLRDSTRKEEEAVFWACWERIPGRW